MRLVLCLCVLSLAVAPDLTAADYFISTKGDDANPGTRQQPFRTVEPLSDILNQPTSDDEVTIYFREGIHFFDEVWTLNPAQPVTIRGWKEEEAVISGGQPIDVQWSAFNENIYRAEWNVEQNEIDELYINNRYYRMARYPNYSEDAKYFGGTAADAVSPERVKRWKNPVGGFVHALHEGLWGSKHYRIEGVKPNHTLELRGGWQENRGGGFDDDFRGGYHKEYLFVENIFEELDAPGEWYFDRQDNVLYVYPYPDDDLSNAQIIGTRLHELIRVSGSMDEPVSHTHFKNLTFQHTSRVFMQPYERLLRGDWSIARLAAVRLQKTEHCAVTDCVFQDLGGNAVFVDGYNRNTTVSNNYFTRLGESAVCVVGNVEAVRSPAMSYSNTLPQDEIDRTPGPKTDEYPAVGLIENNLIHDIGRIGKQTAGVFLSMAEEITVRHNTIYNCPRAAICINDGCWGGHIIEHNDAFQTVQESGDHGPFNSWGRDRFWKTSYNGGRDIEPFAKERALLDHHKTTHIRHNRFAHAEGHSWGIDLDDGSSNYRVYNNLCLGMGVKLREGFFRRVENNIIINGFGGFHIWFPDCEDVIERNIFISDKPYQFIRANPAHAKSFDHNLFYNNGAVPVITGVGDPMTFAEWQEKGFDQHSIVADPQFINPAEGDYRVQDDSPALALGFENFSMDDFGVTKPEFKQMVRQIDRYWKTTGDQPNQQTEQSQATMTWLGATLKNLSGEAEQSAAGMTEETGVLFVEVPSDRKAQAAGFQNGDVLIKWNGQSVPSLSALKQFIADSESYPAVITVFNAVERVIHLKQP